MMTPQEVASHAFAKAALGGYNMAMVDEFLDLLTEDYTSLYNDNAILKNKLKVLSETLEEYQATDKAMRKTLLAAQQTAEAMVDEAEKKKAELLRSAEDAVQSKVNELSGQITAEEQKLQRAKEATAAYVRQVKEAHASALSYLDRLDELTAGVELADPSPTVQVPDLSEEQAPAPVEETAEEAETTGHSIMDDDPYTVDPDATRRFEDLQFGKNYEIT